MGLLKRFLVLALASSAARALAVPAAAAAVAPPEYPQEDIDSGKALQDMSKLAMETALKRISENPTETCNSDNVRVRKEWRSIPGEERIEYVKAVNCLMNTPDVYRNISGSKTLFDSFGLLHYYQTPYVHNSAWFLLFHRLYIWTFEDKLRTVCNYQGAFPYWEWGLDVGGVEAGPVFDGSPTSMGGNGEKVNKTAGGGGGGGGDGGPPGFSGGTGGGCVKSGPFSNYTVNFGPLTQEDPLAPNPRCLKRDLNTELCRRSTTLKNTTEVVLQSPGVELFQANLQGDFRYPESRKWGFSVHGGGHFIIAGDPGGDFYFSPLEPAFYLHHGQIDRMYFVWQNLDWENRQDVAGTITMMDRPPSRNGTLEDVLDLSPVGGAHTLGEMIDTVGGSPFCFVYE